MAPRPRRIEPGPGQESVWDYPRPPRLDPTDEHVRVVVAGTVVADTRGAVRVLETSQAPAYYLPPDDVRTDLLVPSPARSFCEWKGTASYVDVVVGDRVVEQAGWTYPAPSPDYAALAGWYAFYAQRVDEAWVGDERVTANDGTFYGGWITSRVVGPFKGASGTLGW